ncbi:efflux RND transporter periplasmic adaptor subunit [Vibrio sonorensis]|uniref:efflux RND transporter periplasmic adaptor subunit n=1 Tax=Vibrio sonorensis TaxID=1004316 RepID=UPI0008DB242E|nr:efflux RND transporter periplasmic adaptor subunit [Vibrio sonorensis]
MFKKYSRWLMPVAIAALGTGGYYAVAATKDDAGQEKQAAPQPLVSISQVHSSNHKVVITSHGELKPVESTKLSAQVSGEVIDWHPSFVRGGVVKRGELLFSIEKDNYEAKVLQAEASLASARSLLIEEQAKAEVAKRQAKNLPKKQVTDLYLRKPQLLSANAKVKSAQAELKRARRDLENCKVVAPYDALIVERNIGVGQYVSAGAHVAILHNIESGEVHIPIAGFDTTFLPEDYDGIEATVTQHGIARVTRNGFVVRDLGIVDSATRMINMVVRIEDPYGLETDQKALKFGSYVEVQFVGKELHSVYKVPQEWVRDRKIWVVNEKDQLEARTVNILRSEDEFMFIGEGLFDNDKVAVTIPEYPVNGMSVEVASSSQEEQEEQTVQ